MEMTDPDISPPKHKALMSDLNKHLLSVDPKASWDNLKGCERPSFKASLAQSHNRFKAGGKSGPILTTCSAGSETNSFIFFIFLPHSSCFPVRKNYKTIRTKNIDTI